MKRRCLSLVVLLVMLSWGCEDPDTAKYQKGFQLRFVATRSKEPPSDLAYKFEAFAESQVLPSKLRVIDHIDLINDSPFPCTTLIFRLALLIDRAS